MNRQYKRLMAKQEAAKRNAPRPVPKAPGATTKKERTKPRQFVREVGAEMKKVAWPPPREVFAYSVVVVVSVVFIGALIFGMDYVFAKAILALFGVN